MSRGRLLRASDHRRMPWKNGGGETIEIAVHPPGADLAGFDWRISMASVAHDGPFSRFEGVDRTLAVLTGHGMDLEIEGMGRRSLTAGSDPLAFPADAPTGARLHDGAITDLNVMTRRGVCRHRVALADLRAGVIELRGRWSFVTPLLACRIQAGDAVIEAGPGDAVAFEAPDGRPIVIGAEALAAYLIEIDLSGD